ncbi:MAG: hypothetical protein ACFNNC_06980, partial [Rothia dentocariosa]
PFNAAGGKRVAQTLFGLVPNFVRTGTLDAYAGTAEEAITTGAAQAVPFANVRRDSVFEVFTIFLCAE